MTTENKKPQPASILVVDDTLANLQLLAGLLKDRGYRVRWRSAARWPCKPSTPSRLI